MTSIPGIGTIVATELILATNEFKGIDDPKKLACHAGVAPFEHSSGSSVRGKTAAADRPRESSGSKVIENLTSHGIYVGSTGAGGAARAVTYRIIISAKSKKARTKCCRAAGAVINALRNKLIHRVYAVVKRGKKYNKIYTPALV